MSEPDYLTKERAEAILAEAYPNANARKVMCGGCGVWSGYFPLGDLEDAPPGWMRTGDDEHAWAHAPLCPDCQEKRGLA